MDLEGLDFSQSCKNDASDNRDAKPLSSSTEDMSSCRTQLYPDISHAFSELRREQQFQTAPLSNTSYGNSSNPSYGNSSNLQYGWNPSIFGAQPTVAFIKILEMLQITTI